MNQSRSRGTPKQGQNRLRQGGKGSSGPGRGQKDKNSALQSKPEHNDQGARKEGNPTRRNGRPHRSKDHQSNSQGQKTRQKKPAPGHYFFYGRHAVEAAIKNPRRKIKELWISEETLSALPGLRKIGQRFSLADNKDLNAMLPRDAAHQGIVAEVQALTPQQLERIVPIQPQQSLFIALDQVTDPRNFGAILRSAAALAVRAVIVPERRSAELNAACARAAAGALDKIPVIPVVNLSRALDQLKAAGYWITGLDGTSGQPLGSISYHPRRVIVLGSEGDGMRRLVGETCDETVSIPIEPSIESLNVSVAASLAIYAVNALKPEDH